MAEGHGYRKKPGEKVVRKLVYRSIFSALTICATILYSTTTHANNGWNAFEIIDMTDSGKADLDFVVTTGFLHDLDLVAYESPLLSISPEDVETDLTDEVEKTGWAGLVEVEVKDDKTLPLNDISVFSDDFATTERNTKVSGFYSMRYEFNSKLPFRPYAGAGLGLVATSNKTETGGVIAGRAIAGFDLTVGKETAIFAEYAYVKSGGVSLGVTNNSSAAIPDNEHSLKLGFRRTF